MSAFAPPRFLDATNAGCLGSDKDAWRASFDGSTANVTLSNAAGVVTTMATPLKVTHAVNCAAEQPTLTLQLPTEAASTLTVGGYDVAAALMTLGAKVADYDALVAALTPIAGCHSITDEATCVASKDNRAAHLNAPCTWCCGAACTGGSNGKCQPFNYLLSGGGHVNGYIGTGTNGAGYNICPDPAQALAIKCGTPSPVQWRYGALGQDCNAVCSIAGKSCDANALTTHTRNTECNTALAANLGVTCNQGGYSSSAMRPGYKSGDGNCYYANPATTLDCAASSSTNARFCPCSSVIVGGMRWYTSAGGSPPSCNSICTSAGKTCNAAAIQSVTLESDCATQIAVLTGFGLSSGGCNQCGPSDSTNRYCFPGRAGGSSMYYHTSFAAGGFNCATVPDTRTNPSICPCT